MQLIKIFSIKVLFLLALCLGVWAYYPGLSGNFIFDDVPNIATNDSLKIDQFATEYLLQASWSGDSGPLRRPIAMFSFAVNHIFTGMNPWWMKLSNLLIHIGNTLILLFFCKELFCQINLKEVSISKAAPYIISGIWLVHPVNVTAVSYIVQRMASLSGTFVLLALYCYLKLRNDKFDQLRAWILGPAILICWLLGLLTKEIAISLSLYLFAIEWCLYSFHTTQKTEAKYLGVLWMVIAGPWLIALVYFIYNPERLLSDYGFRDFTVVERVLTEFRIVIDYIRLIILPNVGDMGLYHDNIIVSTSLFSPVSTLLSLFLIVGLLVSAFYAKARYPLFSLGIFWFFGGHILESTVYPLELMFLHRNYLPSIGILLALTELAIVAYRLRGKLVLVIVTSLFLVFSFCTRSLTYHWSGDPRMLMLEAMHNPDSIRANFRTGQVYKAFAIVSKDSEKKIFYKEKALEYFQNIENLDKNDIRGKMGMLQTYLQLQILPPPSLIEDLIEVMRFSSIDGGSIYIMHSYKECMVSGECLLTIEEYHRILESLLNNETVGGDFRRRLLINHADYMARARNNVDGAITTVLGALIEYPTANDLMLLAQYYEEGGYNDQVIRTVDRLEEEDKHGRFRKFIRETRARISDRNFDAKINTE